MKRQSPRKTAITVLLTGVAPSSVPYKGQETKIRVVWNNLDCGDFPIKIVIPHKRGLTAIKPHNKEDPEWENYFVRPNERFPWKVWTRRTRKPTILPAIDKEDQGRFYANRAMFMVRTRAHRVAEIQILDQYGDPIHKVYETSSKGWIVSDERFEPVGNKRFIARGHMAQLAGSDGWIQHKSHGKKGMGLNEKGIWPDQLSINYAYPVFSRPFGAYHSFRFQDGRFVPAAARSIAVFDKARKELLRASRRWSRKSTNTFWAFLNEGLPRQPGAKQGGLLEAFMHANEGAARMYLRMWGHTLKGSVVRTVTVTPAKRGAPTFVARDK